MMMYCTSKESKKEGNDQQSLVFIHYNRVPHLTQDTVWESDKDTRKHLMQESQEVSHFSTGDHKPSRNKHDNMAKTKSLYAS